MKHFSSQGVPPGRRHRATAQERQRWIQAWEESQQTQTEFAAEHGLNVGTLRSWLRRTSRPPADELNRPKFVEIDLERFAGSESTCHPIRWEFEVRLPCGRVVAVAPQASTERLRSVLELLRC